MKKLISILLILTLVLSALSACNSSPSDDSTPDEGTSNEGASSGGGTSGSKKENNELSNGLFFELVDGGTAYAVVQPKPIPQGVFCAENIAGATVQLMFDETGWKYTTGTISLLGSYTIEYDNGWRITMNAESSIVDGSEMVREPYNVYDKAPFYYCAEYLILGEGDGSKLYTASEDDVKPSVEAKSIVIPENYQGLPVVEVSNGAFFGRSDINKIVIPSTVERIGDKAFYGCERLASIEIPSSVTSIGKRAFYSCDSLTSITIPSSVTSIGGEAFRYCSSLESIEIPSSVTSIGDYVFYDCFNLISIHYDGNKESWNNIEKGTKWDYTLESYTIYCTDENITK